MQTAAPPKKIKSNAENIHQVSEDVTETPTHPWERREAAAVSSLTANHVNVAQILPT